MKKESQPHNALSDGSQDYGNGVLGPSTADLQRANSSFNEQPKTKEEPNNHLVLVSQESKLGRFFKGVLGRVPKRFILPAGVALSLVATACSGGGGEKNGNNGKELGDKESGYSLPFPEGETWFLTTGPHEDGSSNGVKYAIDIAPPEGGFCPEDGRKFTIDNRVVTASASGEVIIKGDDKNRNDPHHSEIRIKDKNGLTQTYIHLDNTKKVKVGTKVKQGDPLGNPSCEFPPGGGNTGPHVHIGLMKDGQAIPIDGAVLGGWTIHEGANGQEGTMTKEGEKTRTANVGRYADANGEIRNDLPNNSNKAVVAVPKSPIPPISGQITSKEASPKETWKTFKSPVYPYEIQYPASWKIESGKFTTDKLFDDSQGKDAFVVYIDASPADPNTTLDNYVKRYIEKYRHDFLGLEPNEKLPELVTLTVKNGKTAGLSNQTIQLDKPVADGYSLSTTLFIEPRADGSRWIWEIFYESKPTVSRTDRDSTLNRFLDSFKLVPLSALKSTEIPKLAIEKKISLSKKPEELFRALLTNSISPNILPQGMSSGGISAGEIDATGKALKEVGAVTIAIKGSVSQAVGYGVIFYGIFPDSSTAKSASEIIGTNLSDGQVLKNFPYPAKVYTSSFFGSVTKTVVMSVENVTVAVSLTGTDPGILESRAISLSQAAIKHLEKVGK